MSEAKRSKQEIDSVLVKATMVKEDHPQYRYAYGVATALFWIKGLIQTEDLLALIEGPTLKRESWP